MADQYIMYDKAVLDWIRDTFGALVQSKPFSVTVGTPDRAFAEYVTTTPLDPAGRPPLPRIALTVGEAELDPSRFNSNDIRKLGYVNDERTGLRRAKYPTPIKIPYTLNFWTEYEKEMNLYKQELLQAFRFQYLYIPVDIDTVSPYPVYGTKDVGLFAESGIVNSGNAPDVGERKEKTVRRTFNMHMNAWLWDVKFGQAGIVQEVEARFYNDAALTSLLEISRAPQRHKWITADGITTYYGPILVSAGILPIVRGTFIIDAMIGGEVVRAKDDSNGNLVGIGANAAKVLGTVDYSTGSVVANYTSPPDNATDITVAYYTRE